MITRKGKLFVCDLDGVLVQSDGTIKRGDLQSVKEFIDDGGMFVICTGRLDQDIQYVEEQIGVKGSFRISQNGAVIKNKNDEIVFHKTIDKKFVGMLNHILSQHDVRTEINDLHNRYYPTPRDPENIAEFVDTSIVKENLFDYAEQNLDPTIYLNFGEPDQFDEIKKEIQEALDDQVTVARTSLTSLEVFSNEASKGNAVKYISAQLNMDKENILAAGDSESDVTMFPYVGTSFAVSEGCDEKVIEAADYHVLSIEEMLTKHA